MSASARADLVLVGGGHTHVHVLRRWIEDPVAGTTLTLIVDRTCAVYSGMVPGFVAGDYAAHELEIDVDRLARRAGARVVVGAATSIDPVARHIEVEGGNPIPYDLASLDVGSTVKGCELPGVRSHALLTRPIRAFVDGLEARATQAARRGTVRVAVVGAGAAGVEIGFTLRARLVAAGATPRMTVLCEGADVLPGDPPQAARRVRREAERRGIAIVTGARVRHVAPDAVALDGTDRIAADLVVWATGAAPVPLLAASALPLDAAGFVRVRPTLEVVGHDDLFAVGDCASIEDVPWIRKAGVYAVREGPILDANLRARIRGGRLRPFRPQRQVLSLINLGERRALASKWGIVLVGGWVWRWKDVVDRRFVRRFRVEDTRSGDLPIVST